MNNLEQYKGDLERLIAKGEKLKTAMEYGCGPREFEEELREHLDDESIADFIRQLPSFPTEYQAWYSEAGELIRQLLPNRLDDFSSYYEKPKTRKGLTYESYRISDYLLNLHQMNVRGKVIVDPSAAIPRFEQQLAIVKAVKNRFESSLFKISQLVQADLFDSELEAAKALAKNGFLRAAGAVAGVVMERHLAQVCDNHAITLSKRAPTIADLNDALKDVLDFPQWRANQHLSDIRNRCVHNKGVEPTKEQVNDLVDGVIKLTKMVS
jgi:hypothetical protein